MHKTNAHIDANTVIYCTLPIFNEMEKTTTEENALLACAKLTDARCDM